jgi:hypothetical protein
MTFPEPTRIEGVVSSTGGLLGKAPALVVILRPWTDAAGKSRSTSLRVEVPLSSERGIDRMMRSWDGKTVTLSVKTVRAARGNFLEQIVARSPLRRVAPSRKLTAEAKRQKKPRRVVSRVLGALVLDREMGWYEGKRRKGKLAYDVCVDTPEPDRDAAVAKAVERASAVALDVERELPRIRDAIADALLDTYNDGWRDAEAPLSAAAFKRRHELRTLVVTKTRVTLYFDCDGMFTDHAVEARLSPRLAVREICISG